MAAGVSVDDIRNKNRILLVDAHLEKKKRRAEADGRGRTAAE